MEDPSTLLTKLGDDDLQVLRRLSSEGTAWIVGGWVRDGFSSTHNSDLDIATNLVPADVIRLFPDSLTHGARFGTIGVRIPGNGKTWEVTSLRSEAGYTDGRRPDAVVFGKNIIEDLSRRDFTVNSMAISFPDGEFLDPFGGIGDLQSKTIRTVGNPSKRFSEDGLRILRGYRFLSASDLWSLSDETEAAMKECVSMIDNVSSERIGSEIRRIINLPSGGNSLKLMQQHGILEKILPGANLPDRFRTTGDVSVDMALLYADSDVGPNTSSDTLKENLKLTKEEISIFDLLMSLQVQNSLVSPEEIRRFHVAVPPEWKGSVMRYFESKGEDRSQILSTIEPPVAGAVPLVDGNTLSEFTGLDPGIRLGRLKGHLHRLQIERDMTCKDEVLDCVGEIDYVNGDPLDWELLSWP
ncbi:MAG: CCA tRNA nucleotidyltransferase [Candidatus Thermoplasmatota archaeon]|nr:CCA tRNA nucleotidyltransferase [Candidatus Thermoplasmatota archaeon]